ncbi:MAG: hypothetical protein NC517_10530 [Firmicutes bacterium]|nr:hypothetical protein [Bacillota bacterium]
MRLSLSKVYLIERANHYQIRFRIGCRIPFIHPKLLEDTRWIVEDSAGSSYTSDMVIYEEQVAGRNCINVTLILDGEEYAKLAGKELYITAACAEEGKE